MNSCMIPFEKIFLQDEIHELLGTIPGKSPITDVIPVQTPVQPRRVIPIQLGSNQMTNGIMPIERADRNHGPGARLTIKCCQRVWVRSTGIAQSYRPGTYFHT